MYITGLIGFMGNGDLWIDYEHYMGIYDIRSISINPHKAPINPEADFWVKINPHSP